MNNDYEIKRDLELLLDDGITIEGISFSSGVSLRTIKSILSGSKSPLQESTLEKLYADFYRRGLRLNQAKEEIFREKWGSILFHGSRFGIESISPTGSRANCDFGSGFYLGESYIGAAEFVFDAGRSSIYAFRFRAEGLNVVQLDCSLEWMILICYFRGSIEKYKNCAKVRQALESIQEADVIVAPIADNKMFYVMQQFASGEITTEQALYSLAASSLGRQYVFKTKKAIDRLEEIERLYLPIPEREEIETGAKSHAEKIVTKLKIAKREYRGKGLYIDELFHETV